MRIVSDTTKTVFYLPDFPRAKRLGRLLGMLDLDRVNLGRAMRNRWTVRRAKPPATDADLEGKEDYAKVAIIADPASVLVDQWRYMFHSVGIRARVDVNRLRDLEVLHKPSFSWFLSDLDTYRDLVPATADFTDTQRLTLGDDLGVYDKIIHLDREGEMEAYLTSVSDKILPAGYLVMDPQWPEILVQPTLEAVREVTASEYALLDGHYTYEASDIHSTLWRPVPPSKARKVPPILRNDSPPTDWFDVVIIIKETPEVVRRFVNYYAAIGAHRIHMYFDDPEDPSIDLVKDHPQVNAIRCDENFWQGKRRKTFEGRQSLVYTHAYRQIDKGWLLAVDADEFIASRGTPLPDLFANAPEDCRVIRFSSHEAIWAEDQDATEPFSARYVRRFMTETQWGLIRASKEPRVRDLFRKGILSHRSGKYAVRAGQDVQRLATHQTMFNDGYNGMHPPGRYERGILVHFDAISYAHWEAKFVRRLKRQHGFAGFGPGRKQQHDLMRALDPSDYPGFHADLYKVSPDELQLLNHLGLAFELRIFDDLPDSVGALAPASAEAAV